MSKVILILWTLSADGSQIDRLELDGFMNMEHCWGVADSLTAPNPKDGWSPLQVVRCATVPK